MARCNRLCLVVSALVVLGGCPATTSQGGGTQVEVEGSGQPGQPGQPGQGQPPEASSGGSAELPAGLAEDLKDYLRAVHKLIGSEWEVGVLARASSTFPPTHPANQRSLMAEVAISLDLDGQLTAMRVSKSSGYQPFDESALGVMRLARKLPPLPRSAGEGFTTLFWRFHRDERSCSPAFARLESKPLTPEEAMRRALARGKLEQAMRILRSAGAAPAVLEVVAGVGLAASQPGSVRRLALQIASPAQLDTALAGAHRTADGWRLTLGALAARGDTRRLLALLDRATAAGLASDRLVDLIDTLAWLDAKAAPVAVARLLERTEPAVVVAAANLVRDAVMLDTPLARFDRSLKVGGPLAVRRRALGESARAEELIKKALAGDAALVTLDSIARHGVRAVDATLEALVRTGKAPATVRARAIDILADHAPSLAALYVAVRDKDPSVQIAAARALARAKGNKVAISTRIADVVSRARGEVLAETLAALARVGDERFRDDTLRRAKLLDPKYQPVVAEALGGYGEKAVPVLARMLAQPSPELRAAAARGLARIKTDAAQKLLASQPAPPAAATVGPLQALLQEAVKLARGSRR
jgi:TonB family protein